MKHPISFLCGCIAGALAMYYLDQQSGAWRRRLVRDQMLSAGNDLAHRAGRKGQRALERARGASAHPAPAPAPAPVSASRTTREPAWH